MRQIIDRGVIPLHLYLAFALCLRSMWWIHSQLSMIITSLLSMLTASKTQ